MQLDINHTLADPAGHILDAYGLDTRGRQHIDLSSQELLQVIHELDKSKADGSLKLNDNIDVASLTGGPRGKGTEQAEPSHTKLSGQIGVAFPQPLGDCLSREHFRAPSRGQSILVV